MVKDDLTWECQSDVEFSTGQEVSVEVFQTDFVGNDSKLSEVTFKIADQFPLWILIIPVVIVLLYYIYRRRKEE